VPLVVSWTDLVKDDYNIEQWILGTHKQAATAATAALSLHACKTTPNCRYSNDICWRVLQWRKLLSKHANRKHTLIYNSFDKATTAT